jgi:MFS family permease
MSHLLAGLISGIPLALIFGIHTLLRRDPLIRLFQDTEEGSEQMDEQTLFILLLGGFMLTALFLGLISGLVLDRVGSTFTFRVIAFSAAGLFSVLAVISRTPLTGDKIIWNLAVGLILGWLVPLFAA